MGAKVPAATSNVADTNLFAMELIPYFNTEFATTANARAWRKNYQLLSWKVIACMCMCLCMCMCIWYWNWHYPLIAKLITKYLAYSAHLPPMWKH